MLLKMSYYSSEMKGKEAMMVLNLCLRLFVNSDFVGCGSIVSCNPPISFYVSRDSLYMYQLQIILLDSIFLEITHNSLPMSNELTYRSQDRANR